jgi:hypothetical protein
MAIDVALIARVASGGRASGSPVAAGAADDGAPQALSVVNAARRIPSAAFMRGIILH